jgi:hypothetical protein
MGPLAKTGAHEPPRTLIASASCRLGPDACLVPFRRAPPG